MSLRRTLPLLFGLLAQQSSAVSTPFGEIWNDRIVPAGPGQTDRLLTEAGDTLITESYPRLLQESGSRVLAEDGATVINAG